MTTLTGVISSWLHWLPQLSLRPQLRMMDPTWLLPWLGVCSSWRALSLEQLRLLSRGRWPLQDMLYATSSMITLLNRWLVSFMSESLTPGISRYPTLLTLLVLPLLSPMMLDTLCLIQTRSMPCIGSLKNLRETRFGFWFHLLKTATQLVQSGFSKTKWGWVGSAKQGEVGFPRVLLEGGYRLWGNLCPCCPFRSH
jgi:hypothetical protein